MSSAVKVILGVSVLAMAAGFAACDNGSTDTGTGPVVAGSGNGTAGGAPGTAGAPASGGGSPGTAGSTANGGVGALPEGVPLDPLGGWVPNSNALGIQGAMFSYSDKTSAMGMTDNLMDATSTNACIKGVAAKVDMTSTPCTTMMFDSPATDCYGQYWGAAIGLNLNQKIDMTLMPPAGGTPGPYDASQLKGFAFVVDGNMVPAPGSFRFKVDNVTTEFCNVPTVKIKVGVNTVLFTDLVKECYKTPVPTEPLATTIQTGIVKISWQVVTNDKSTVPFDFCISNVRALMKDGTSIPMGGAGASGSSAGASGSSAGAASTSAGAGGASAGAGGASAGAAGAKAGSGGTAG